MNKTKYLERVIFLLTYIMGLFFIFHNLGHSILNNNVADVFLFSSLSALAINILLMSCFFETPKDVIASSLNVLILLSGIYLYDGFSKPLFNGLLIYTVVCLMISVSSVLFYDPDYKIDNWKQRLSIFLKKTSIAIGSSKIIFSVLIASLLINAYSDEGIAFYTFTGMALILLANEPIRELVLSIIVFIKSFFNKKSEELPDPIGSIAAVQSKDTFVIDLIDIKKRPSCNLFDFVEFKYGTDNHYFRGFIIDRYYLDSIQKIKILKTSAIEINDNNKDEYSAYKSNIAYKIKKPNKEEVKILQNFVGTVTEKSDMVQIKFEYSSKKQLTNGDLLVIDAKNKKNKSINVLYQVTQAQTEIKNLENKNEVALITASATQLGVWQNATRNFENYGWVPSINTKVMLTNNNITGPIKRDKEIKLGTIEDTTFDVLVNINDLVTHHTAILGTTGTGKSVFSRDIIKKLASDNNKIFYIDLTGEAKKFIETKELINLKSQFNIIENKTRDIASCIKYMISEKAKYADKQNSLMLEKITNAVEKHMKDCLQEFIQDEANNIGLFELPELSNTEETLEYRHYKCYFTKTCLGLNIFSSFEFISIQ